MMVRQVSSVPARQTAALSASFANGSAFGQLLRSDGNARRWWGSGMRHHFVLVRQKNQTLRVGHSF